MTSRINDLRGKWSAFIHQEGTGDSNICIGAGLRLRTSSQNHYLLSRGVICGRSQRLLREWSNLPLSAEPNSFPTRTLRLLVNARQVPTPWNGQYMEESQSLRT